MIFLKLLKIIPFTIELRNSDETIIKQLRNS